jgi:putative endonuclease
MEKSHTMEKYYYVYIMASKSGVLYVGATNDLVRRVFGHKKELIKDFTKKYRVKKLVYFEQTSDILSAIGREKPLKKWRREKKINLVKMKNSAFRDLSEDWG